MTLTLDHITRLNLVAVLDLLECKGRREAWSVCRLQEQLDLDEGERGAIDLRRESAGDGREYYRWDQTRTLAPRNYELPEEDVQRICRALDNVPLVLGRDRWYKSLEAQLPQPAEANGNHA